MAWTAKNMTIQRAPRRIVLLGEKTQRPESAQHTIEFPGGAIELSRTTDGCYWAHIIINQDGDSDGDHGSMTSAHGAILDSRIDTAAGVIEIPHAATCRQIAVLIQPRRDA
jgi:hypothetical protein